MIRPVMDTLRSIVEGLLILTNMVSPPAQSFEINCFGGFGHKYMNIRSSNY